MHRARSVHPDDCTVHEGIPVTTVARTLLDLAETLSPTQLQHASEKAERLGMLDMRQIERLFERSRGRRGLKPLTALVEEHRGPAPLTRSELVELDGHAYHRTRAAFERDRVRDAALQETG